MTLFKKLRSSLSGQKHDDKTDSCCSTVKEDKAIRENKTSKEVDKTIEDTFPASDPPSNY